MVVIGRALRCIDDTVEIGMNIPVIGRKGDGNRLVFKCSLYSVCQIVSAWRLSDFFDGDVGGLGGRVEAVGCVITLSP